MTVPRAAVIFSVILSLLLLSHADPNTQSKSTPELTETTTAVIQKEPLQIVDLSASLIPVKTDEEPSLNVPELTETTTAVIKAEPQQILDLSASLIPVKADEEPSLNIPAHPKTVDGIVVAPHHRLRRPIQRHFHHVFGVIRHPRTGCRHRRGTVVPAKFDAPEKEEVKAKMTEEERREHEGLVMASDVVNEWKHRKDKEEEHKRKKREKKELKKKKEESDSDSDDDDDDDEKKGGFLKRIWKMFDLF